MTKKDVINTLEKIGDDTINGIKSSHGNIRIKIENFKILAENSLLFKGEMKGVIYANALTKIYFWYII